MQTFSAHLRKPRIPPGDAGFTYLWVLLLVAFMGLSLVLATDIQSTLTRRDQERELLAIGRQFRGAIASYYELSAGGGPKEYPATLEDLLRDNRSPGIRRHLRKVFIDPMTGKAEWGLERVSGRIAGIHSLSSRLPIKQDGFAPEDAAFRGKQKYSDWVFTHPANLLLQTEAESAAGSPSRQSSVEKASSP